MHHLRHILFVVVISLFSSGFAQSVTSDNTKSGATPLVASDVQAQLDALASRNLSEAEKTAAQNHLQQALQFIGQREDYQKKLNRLNTNIKEAPERLKDYRQQLEALSNQAPKDITESLALMNDNELSLYVSELNTQLGAWKVELSEINKELLQVQTRPEQIQITLNTLNQRQQALAQQIESSAITSDEQLSIEAEQQAITAQAALLRQELNNNVLFETTTLRKKILEQQIESISSNLEVIQKTVEQRRLLATEKTIQDAQQVAADVQQNDSLQKEKDTNTELAEYLRKSTIAINEVTQISNDVNAKLERITRTEQTLTQQIKLLKGNTSLFELLYQQKKNLPVSAKNSEKLTEELGKLRLNQFYLNRSRDEFADPNTYVNHLLQDIPADEETTRGLLELAKKREELYSSLQMNLSELINLRVNLQIAQKQLEVKTQEVSHIIDEQMFWTPSNQPISLSWFKQQSPQFQNELKSTVSFSKLTETGKAIVKRPWVFLPLVLVIFLLLIKRKKIHHAIDSINNTLGRVEKDTQFNTPMVLLFNILLALPLTLAFALTGIAQMLQGQDTNIAHGSAFLELALGWLVFNVTYLMLGKNNIAIKHFGLAPERALVLRKRIIQIGMLVLAMSLIISMTNAHLDNITQNGIYIVAMLICYPLLSFLLAKTFIAYKGNRQFKVINWLLVIAIVLTPLALMVAAMAGYYFTATKITVRLIYSFYIVLLYILLNGMIMRWLKVEARRLAYQRATEKRQAQIQIRSQEQTAEDAPSIIEEPKLDVATINQQSLKVMHLLTMGLMLFSLYFVWADVLVVFNHLNSITLYHYMDPENKLVALSLLSFIAAIIIFIVMILLVRNLPGLLEIVILSRLRLSKGVSYAITTLLSYVIIAFGVSVFLGILGVSWSKLQWLVAALSVGLGFGLQEIFANFISGIIMLFERPIRIGDRITIGSSTGTVKRINIRATHMIDTEGKDVIIPNKTFVTGQLINWTLTNTVTRISLQIGVAYNSDIDQVKKLLLQIAHDNPRVVKDPAPSVSFSNFGADALEVQLSLQVNEIADRTAATDEINSQIYKVFAREQIEIPYHHIDVTLKNSQGQTLNLN